MAALAHGHRVPGSAAEEHATFQLALAASLSQTVSMPSQAQHGSIPHPSLHSAFLQPGQDSLPSHRRSAIGAELP
jgi:hypothetical protein